MSSGVGVTQVAGRPRPRRAGGAYDTLGEGPAVVLLHDLALNRSIWHEQMSAIAAGGYRAVALDLPGHGVRTPVAHRTDFSHLAQDVADRLDELDCATAVLVGVGLGGETCLQFYRDFPRRVDGLVLCGTTAANVAAVDEEGDRWFREDEVSARHLARYAYQTWPRLLVPETMERRPASAQDVLGMMLASPPGGAAAAHRARRARVDFRPLLPSIAVPALVVVGDADEYVPVEQARLMCARIPDARIEVIAGAGHLPMMERPDEVSAAIIDFLHQGCGRGPGEVGT